MKMLVVPVAAVLVLLGVARSSQTPGLVAPVSVERRTYVALDYFGGCVPGSEAGYLPFPYTVPLGKTLVLTSGTGLYPNNTLSVELPGGVELARALPSGGNLTVELPNVVVRSGQVLSSSGRLSGYLVDETAIVHGKARTYVAITEAELPYAIPAGKSLVVTAMGGRTMRDYELKTCRTVARALTPAEASLVPLHDAVVLGPATIYLSVAGTDADVGEFLRVFGFLTEM